jgi:hypothetical protein
MACTVTLNDNLLKTEKMNAPLNCIRSSFLDNFVLYQQTDLSERSELSVC